MEELKQYNELILTRQRNPLPEDTVTEEHHIWPTSCGGPDEEWNKVRLTPEEHYRAHQLLAEIYTDPENRTKMCYASWLIAHTRDGVEITPEEYGELKRNFVKAMKNRQSPTLGLHHSNETRRKMSQSHLGHVVSEETRRKMSESQKRNPNRSWLGRHHSKETKEKLRQRQLGNHVTAEIRAKISATMKARWNAKSPEEKAIKCSNLAKAREKRW